MKTAVKTSLAAFLALSAITVAAMILAPTTALTSAISQTATSQLHNVAHAKTVASALKRKRSAVSKNTLAANVLPAAPALLPIVDQPDIHQDQRLLSDKTLRALPALCRDNVKNFYILYSGAKERGLGGKTSIMIDGAVTGGEFISLIVHECGHVIHGNLLGDLTTGPSAFRDGNDMFAANSPAAGFFAISWQSERIMRAGATDNDFASGYAKSDSFEDFAETFTLYVMHRDAFRQHAKTSTAMALKLQWMETNLPLPENVLGQSTYVWNGSVPWDVTKLPVTLKQS